MAKNKRVNLKAILADPDLRRKLMVSTIQATQAREGIDTTEEQADRAYYVVTESERTAFFDLGRHRPTGPEGDRREAVFVQALRDETPNVRFDVARRDFATIEGSPLPYRRIGHIAALFRENQSISPAYADIKIGHQTFDDSRFVRWWWEKRPSSQLADKAWPPFAKGGAFSRFYADVGLVVRWDREAHEAYEQRKSNFKVLLTSSRSEFLYRPGLTWPRAGGHFSLRWMPLGCVFADKGPAVFPHDASFTAPLAGVLNSAVAEYIMKGLVSRQSMGARWEAGVVKRLPIPNMAQSQRDSIGEHAKAICEHKSAWDRGNELSTQFDKPWLLRTDLDPLPITTRQLRLIEIEASEEARIQQQYAELNDEVYKLYGIPDSTRAIIEETLGDRPREILWPQMERKTVEQKRMEHVWRLLSYVVKRVVEADEDGIVPFAPLSGEKSLLDRVHQELALLFPEQDVNQVEVEITNELKHKVKGYKRASNIGEWLENVYFDYHVSLYKKRPIIWHIASSQGSSPFAFGVLCHYHKLDKNRMAKLRAGYLRDAIEAFRREAALADQEGRAEDRVEWQAKLEEAQALDHKLQAIQEGHHEGADGGDRDYGILTPWKSPEDRPKGWDPDIDDGVKVNIGPLEKAGVLRVGKVV